VSSQHPTEDTSRPERDGSVWQSAAQMQDSARRLQCVEHDGVREERWHRMDWEGMCMEWERVPGSKDGVRPVRGLERNEVPEEWRAHWRACR
jgi:hypothetical protein